VAELTLGMILTLLRRIHISDASIRQGKWERPMGGLLHEKTVGIIGCGRIGSYLAKLLSAFGCRVLGCDLVGQEGKYYEPVNLDEILLQADVVTLQLSYSEKNHYIINAERLQAMKPGALLINTARGGLVDEEALYEALKRGHLGGAALDCFESEPYSGLLKELDNVLLTAHIGSYAQEGRQLMEQQAVENLLHELRRCGVIE